MPAVTGDPSAAQPDPVDAHPVTAGGPLDPAQLEGAAGLVAAQVEAALDPDQWGPGYHLRAQLARLAPGQTAMLIIGDSLALVGAFTGDVELTGVDSVPSGVAPVILVAACSCPNPDTDVDPDCKRHYPDIPEELISLVARAINAGRDWEYGGRGSAHLDRHQLERLGVNERDVNAAIAALTVLLHPGRHGVFCNEPRPDTDTTDPANLNERVPRWGDDEDERVNG